MIQRMTFAVMRAVEGEWARERKKLATVMFGRSDRRYKVRGMVSGIFGAKRRARRIGKGLEKEEKDSAGVGDTAEMKGGQS